MRGDRDRMSQGCYDGNIGCPTSPFINLTYLDRLAQPITYEDLHKQQHIHLVSSWWTMYMRLS